jgi:ABC-2 type transport system permease protein
MAGDDRRQPRQAKARDHRLIAVRRDHAPAGLCGDRPLRRSAAPLGKPELIVITATIFLAWALMLSQAIESVTRVFYARADLDLIMSSPANLANVFSVRIAAIALSGHGMALLLSTPFVDVLVIGGGVRWLSAFGVVIAIGLSAAAVAIAITVAAVPADRPEPHRARRADPGRHHRRRLRHRAAGRAILSYGTLSRFAVLTSDAAAAYAPARQPAVVAGARRDRRRHGAVVLMAGGLVLLGVVMAVFSPRFADTVVASRRNRRPVRRGPRATAFRGGRGNRRCAPRNSCCCGAIPWLVSQSLMQLLYLVPPALMLWRSFSESSAAIVLITPVIVMAAGQLAGGLAWLTISGEGRRRPGRDRAAAAVSA